MGLGVIKRRFRQGAVTFPPPKQALNWLMQSGLQQGSINMIYGENKVCRRRWKRGDLADYVGTLVEVLGVYWSGDGRLLLAEVEVIETGKIITRVPYSYLEPVAPLEALGEQASA